MPLTMKRKTRGFTLVELMIVVLIIAVLMAIAIPNWVQARTNSRIRACVENLKHIDAAKEQWAMDQKKDSGATVLWSDICPLYLKPQPECPAAGTYTIAVIGTTPTCTTVGHDIP